MELFRSPPPPPPPTAAAGGGGGGPGGELVVVEEAGTRESQSVGGVFASTSVCGDVAQSATTTDTTLLPDCLQQLGLFLIITITI